VVDKVGESGPGSKIHFGLRVYVRVIKEKPTLFPFSFISRVKKPVIGFSMRRITFSIRVDLPHRGGPVTRIFFDVI
jgi:hypothetical protein